MDVNGDFLPSVFRRMEEINAVKGMCIKGKTSFPMKFLFLFSSILKLKCADVFRDLVQFQEESDQVLQ